MFLNAVFRAALALFAAGLLLGGCASAPPSPDDEIASAELAIREAEQARGQQYAPLQMRIAREKLAQAKASAEAERNEKARRLAEDAAVEAQLASAKANQERAARNRSEAQKTVDALREELGLRPKEVGAPINQETR